MEGAAEEVSVNNGQWLTVVLHTYVHVMSKKWPETWYKVGNCRRIMIKAWAQGKQPGGGAAKAYKCQSAEASLQPFVNARGAGLHVLRPKGVRVCSEQHFCVKSKRCLSSALHAGCSAVSRINLRLPYGISEIVPMAVKAAMIIITHSHASLLT